MAIALAPGPARSDQPNHLPPGPRALFQVEALTGYEALTWGHDEKSVGYVIMARPTMSKAFHPQPVGRGLRQGYRAVAR
jgi:hypothetical protein